MPTGGTHLFSVPAVSYNPAFSIASSSSALPSSSLSPTTSRVNVVLPMSVKSSFSAFVSDCYTSKGDVKLWNNPFFSVPCLLCHDAPVGNVITSSRKRGLGHTIRLRLLLCTDLYFAT